MAASSITRRVYGIFGPRRNRQNDKIAIRLFINRHLLSKFSNNPLRVRSFNLRRVLLGGTSVLAIAAMTLPARPAVANQTISTSQSTPVVGDNGTTTINSGVTVSVTSVPAVESTSSGTITTLTNNGSLIAVGNTNGNGVMLSPGGIIGSIINSATAHSPFSTDHGRRDDASTIYRRTLKEIISRRALR
jgi:hypothetical protein